MSEKYVANESTADEDNRLVTVGYLQKELKKLPTRWETRFLIVVGLGVAQLLPADEVAQAAISLFK